MDGRESGGHEEEIEVPANERQVKVEVTVTSQSDASLVKKRRVDGSMHARSAELLLPSLPTPLACLVNDLNSLLLSDHVDVAVELTEGVADTGVPSVKDLHHMGDVFVGTDGRLRLTASRGSCGRQAYISTEDDVVYLEDLLFLIDPSDDEVRVDALDDELLQSPYT